MTLLVIYLVGMIALQIVEAWDDEPKGVFLFLSFFWPLLLVVAIIISPYIVTRIVREGRHG